MSSSPPQAAVSPRPLSPAERRSLNAEILCPPDKSLTHRAVMFASLAKGKTVVTRPLLGQDCLSTIDCFRALGVTIEVESKSETNSSVRIDGPGWDHLKSPLKPLDFGNSGTTARLMLGILAATDGLFATGFGDDSLSIRPMGRVVKPLRAMGAQISGRQQGALLPLAIEGRALQARHHIVDKASAQVKSALLLAGMRCHGTTSVELPSGSRDHTEQLLIKLGAKIQIETSGNSEKISLTGPFLPPPGLYQVPGDPSSAAFLAVLAALLAGGRLKITDVLNNPTRTGFLFVLRRMGAAVEVIAPPVQTAMEPVFDLVISGGQVLRGVDLEPELVPTFVDEVPILAVCALFAQGPSRFRGLSELRVKESDRLQQTAALLIAGGGQATLEGDDLLIQGGLSAVKGFRFDPLGDHRLAMAAGILAKFAQSPCQILGPDCVDVSFPRFFDVLESIGSKPS